MTTITSNEEPELTQQDCIEWLGSSRAFFTDLLKYQRLGQAWFNSLDKDDREKLRGSFYDPYYAHDWASVIRALRFLLEN